MTTNKNQMRQAFIDMTQGREVTLEVRLVFEAGYLRGYEAAMRDLANQPMLFKLGDDNGVNDTRD